MCGAFSICFLSALQHYFIDAWNSFDALIVVGSVVDIVVTEFSVSPPSAASDWVTVTLLKEFFFTIQTDKRV